MIEEWKFVLNSQCYMISNLGKIKIVDCVIMRKDGKKYTIKEKILKPYKIKASYGNMVYLLIYLNLDVKKHKLIHRLVMESFNPVENMDSLDVNHKNGNKEDNKLENLEWCTKKENMKHARETGLWNPEDRYGEKHPMSKLTEEDVKKIKILLKDKTMKQYQIAEKFNITGSVVSCIKKEKSWKHVVID